MTDPRAFWCPCCGWKLPGLLTVPFVQRCPSCRRKLTAELVDGECTLTFKEVAAVGPVR